MHVARGVTIEWATRAIRDMRRLATRDRERIVAKIEQYARDPASLARQVTPLTGKRLPAACGSAATA